MSKNVTKFKKVKALQNLTYADQRLITEGKTYPVIRGGWRNLYILDDTGDEIKLYHDNPSFKYLTN